MTNITSIPAPRVPFIDERTGLISREWYRFFLNLFNLTGSGTTDASWTDLQLAPSNQSVMVDVDASGVGSVLPLSYGSIPSDEYGLQALPGYPVPSNDGGLVPPYPEQVQFDPLAPTNPVDLTMRVDSMASDLQGLLLLPPAPVASGSVKRGGIRKNVTTQNIGNLGASWVPITNYDISVLATNSGDPTNITKGVILDLTAGTITLTTAGDYVLIATISTQFTSDNNSTRIYGLRIYDVTAAAPVGNADTTIFIGAYASGNTSSFSIPATATAGLVGHALRMEVGAGSAFASFAVPNATLAMYSLGLL